MSVILFNDRADAGRRLGLALVERVVDKPVILALPRGGVPVAAEIARILGAQLDVLIVRKVGAPTQPELAMAAVAEGTPEHVVLNLPVLRHLGLDPDDIAEDVARETREVARRATLYREGASTLPVAGRHVIIVDDGIATGCTMRAGIEAMRRDAPKSIGVAVPVASPEELAEIRQLADWVICLHAPQSFEAVGTHYRNFPQLTDVDVTVSLKARRKTRPMGAAPAFERAS